VHCVKLLMIQRSVARSQRSRSLCIVYKCVNAITTDRGRHVDGRALRFACFIETIKRIDSHNIRSKDHVHINTFFCSVDCLVQVLSRMLCHCVRAGRVTIRSYDPCFRDLIVSASWLLHNGMIIDQ